MTRPLTTSQKSIDTVTSAAPIPTVLTIGSEETEETMDLGRQAIGDIQARLLVLGHDPNGVDGKIGRGACSHTFWAGFRRHRTHGIL